MVNRHKKRRSASLIIRDMQIKTTVRYHLTPVRTAIVNKSTNVGEDVEKREPSCSVGGMQTGAAPVESSKGFPQKLKRKVPYGPVIPLLGIYLKNPKH